MNTKFVTIFNNNIFKLSSFSFNYAEAISLPFVTSAHYVRGGAGAAKRDRLRRFMVF